jgi:2-dehydro-3-deoxygluconokinase
MADQHQVAVIGECMIEFAPKDAYTYQRSFAGDTLNMAVYFARVCPADVLKVHYVTALGDDLFSDEMLAAWQAEGIEVALVQRLKGKLPGLYLIHNDADGERQFYYYRALSPARDLFAGETGEQLCQALLNFNTLYFSGITVGMLHENGRDRFLNMITQAQQKGIQLVFDTNFRAALWPDLATAKIVIQKIQQHVSMALPSFVDEQLLFGDKTPADTAARLHQMGVKEVVVKLGEAGYLLSSPQAQTQVAVTPATHAIDTTGAGDSFNGVYLAARLQGLAPTLAAQKAAQMAAVVVTHRGAIIPKA